MTEATTAAPEPGDLAALVDQMAVLLDLTLDPDHRSGVIANLERTATIAQLVLEFPLPEDLQASPVFQP